MTDTAAPPDQADGPPPDPNAVNVTINGVAHVARKGQLVIEAAADAGVYVPRFCYHERMTPVGKCRMCLVEADSGRGPAVTVSCMVPVAPDMKIDTDSPMAKRMQEGVLELFLANHPLDCPVCDKGGECPLQDQAFSHGPGESRYVEEKRHHEKPIPISELVYLDRERCILCDRCTRFADEVAGDALIHFVSRGNNTQVNTFPDEPFASYFSGNTVQICPVGALTAKPYRFKARPWDLQQSESTCTTCAVGCRIITQSSRNELVRSLGVDNDAVNWGWLCDKGRFVFESTNHEARLQGPAIRAGDTLASTGWNAALDSAAAMIRRTIETHGPAAVAVVGGARGTNEDAYAWARLARDVIGTPHRYAQMLDGLLSEVLTRPWATIDEMANAATIVLLAPDLKEELPVLHLRVRDAVMKRRSRVLEFSPRATSVSDQAWKSVRYLPGEQEAAVRDTLADPAVAAQLASGPVVVVVGKSNLAEAHWFQLNALGALLEAVASAKVLPAYRRGNVVGALQLGMTPGEGGSFTSKILAAAANGDIKCLVLVGADPLSDLPDSDLAERALSTVEHLIAVDTFASPSAQRAGVVLAAAAAGEKSGTVTNLEGRVQTVAQQITPAGTSRPDWMIATQLAELLGHDFGFESVADVTEAIAAEVPAYAGITPAALASTADGLLAVPEPGGPLTRFDEPAPTRNNYSHRLFVSRELYDLGVAVQTSPSLAGLPRGTCVHLHPLDHEALGWPAEVRVLSASGSLVAPAVADPGLARFCAWLPFNQPGGRVADLLDSTSPVNDVRIEAV